MIMGMDALKAVPYNKQMKEYLAKLTSEQLLGIIREINKEIKRAADSSSPIIPANILFADDGKTKAYQDIYNAVQEVEGADKPIKTQFDKFVNILYKDLIHQSPLMYYHDEGLFCHHTNKKVARYLKP